MYQAFFFIIMSVMPEIPENREYNRAPHWQSLADDYYENIAQRSCDNRIKFQLVPFENN